MWLFILCLCFVGVMAQESGCFSAGDVAGAAIGAFVAAIIIIAALYYLRNWYNSRKNGKHLVLSTDPENAKNEFAFDNPGFKNDEARWRHEAPTLPLGGKDSQVKPGPLQAQFATSNLTQQPSRHASKDDLSANKSRVRRVQLWARDFTGLGLTATGGARAGVLVNSVLRAGPAAAADIQPGDKIRSIKITLTGAVLEDAAQILSLASPYPVELEIESPGSLSGASGVSRHVHHPLLKRAGSFSDVQNLEKELRHLRPKSPNTSHSNNSTLEKSIGGIKKIGEMITSTLERAKKDKKEGSLERDAKPQKNRYSDGPSMLKHETHTTRYSTGSDYQPDTIVERSEMQKRENDPRKGMKFGIKVLPPNVPASTDAAFSCIPASSNLDTTDSKSDILRVENENLKPVVAKRREKSAPPVPNARNLNKIQDKPHMEHIVTEEAVNRESFRRDGLNSSGIKRDENGIPQEIPQHMFDAAMQARSNRKSSIECINERPKSEMEVKTPRKGKGKAPSPPDHKYEDDFRAINGFIVNEQLHSSKLMNVSKGFNTSTPKRNKDDTMNFSQDDIDDIVSKPFRKESDSLNNFYEDTKSNLSSNLDGNSVVSLNNSDKGSTTIDLHTSNVTVHGTHMDDTLKSENSSSIDDNERKAASLGDLSRFEIMKAQAKKPSTGTLERAQSLDISGDEIKQTPITPKKRKANSVIEANFYENSNGDTLSELEGGKNILIKTKEPRLSLNIGTTAALEGLSTFQRNRLKKASEFGTLEDAITKGSDSSLEKDGSNDNLQSRKDYELTWNIPENETIHETSDELAKKAIEENQRTNLKLMQDFMKGNSDSSNVNSLNSIDEAIYTAHPAESTFGVSLKYDDKLNLASETNIPDDLKVSRHSLVSSLERPKSDMMKKLLAKNPIVVKPPNPEPEEIEHMICYPVTDSEKKKATNHPDIVNFKLKTFKPNTEDDYISNIKISNNNWVEQPDPNVVTIRTDLMKPQSATDELKNHETFVKSIQIKNNKIPDLVENVSEINQIHEQLNKNVIPRESNILAEMHHKSNSKADLNSDIQKSVSVNVAEDEYGNQIITKRSEQILTKYIDDETDAPIEIEEVTFGLVKNPSAAKKLLMEESDNLSETDEKILDEIKSQNPDFHFTEDEPAYTRTETIILSTNLDEGDALALMDKLKNDPSFSSKTPAELEELGVKVIHDLGDDKIETEDSIQVTKSKYTINTTNIPKYDHEYEKLYKEDQDYVTEIQVTTPRTEKNKQKMEIPKISGMNEFIENEKKHTQQSLKKSPEIKPVMKSQKTDNLPRNSHIMFRTSTYDSPKVDLTSTDKRAAQIDSLRSTFDKIENPSYKPIVSTKPSSIPVIKSPEKPVQKQISPSKIPVFIRSHSQENMLEKGMSLPKSSPTKTNNNTTTSNVGEINVTSTVKSASKNPSGMQFQ